MRYLVLIPNFIFLLGLFIGPIFLLRIIVRTKIKYKLIVYSISGSILCTLLTFVFAWYTYTSDLLLLNDYGYFIKGKDHTEKFENVASKDLEEVKKLEYRIGGIGWPLKAILTLENFSPFLVLYYLVIYVIGQLIRKNRMVKKRVF